MFRIESRQSGGELRKHHVKPLQLIWRKFAHWNAANTLHVDDLQRNFALNPRSGIKIAPYKNSSETRASDQELLFLTRYLAHIATAIDDFTKLDHSQWKKFIANLPPSE